jgi:hypothetical protein
MQVRNHKVGALALVLVVALWVTACDGGEAELSTTSSSLLTATTEAPPVGTTTVPDGSGDDSVTSTTLRGQTVESYDVTARISSDNGEILYIVVPDSDAYTDVDMEGFIGDLLESDPDLWGAEVFKSEEGAEVFVVAEDQRTEEQKQVLAGDHLVSLVGGDTIKFRGPLSDAGEILIGS